MPAMHDQQQIDYWSVARMSKLPGATITTTLDSSQWTTRTRNAVKKMLMQGQIVGGYSSVTAKLAEAIAQQYGVAYHKGDHAHITVSSPHADLRHALSTIIEADYVAHRIEHGEESWSRRRYDTAKKELAAGVHEFSYYFNDRAFAEQARELLASNNPPENVERARVACAAVDQGETFTYRTIQ